MNIRPIATLLIIALLANVVSACSGNKKSEEEEDAVITVLTVDQGSSSLGKQINELFDESKTVVESEYSSIRVNVVRVTDAEYEEKIEELQPDVYWADPTRLTRPQFAGDWYDLRPLLENDGIDIARYYPQKALDLLTVDGELLGIPMTAVGAAVGYSKSWYAKAGLSVPRNDWTWDDFVSDAVALKAANGGDSDNVYGASVPYFPELLESVVISRGGAFISPDGKTASGYLDSAETIETLEWLKTLFGQKLLDEQFMGDLSQLGTREGLTVSTSVGLAMMAETNPDIGIVALPGIAGQPAVTAPYMTSLVVNSASKHPGAAMKYIYALTMDDNELTRKGYELGLSISTPVFEKAGTASDSELAINYNLLPNATRRASATSVAWWKLIQTYSDTFAQSLTTDTEVRTAMSRLAEIADRMLEEQRNADELEAGNKKNEQGKQEQ